MSENTGKEDDALLLEYLIGEKQPKKNIEMTSDDEDMLLLSSSSSTSYSSFPSSSSPVESKKKKTDSSPSAGKSKTKSSTKVVDLNSSTSNIIIEDSSDSSEEGLEDSNSNSVEVIDSEDELEEELDDESDSEESLAAYLDGKVEIFMAQGSFFIWNVEDIHMLREECRIVGKLVGCLPRAPRQNNQLGLPLQLMPEEAKLLEEIEAACIVEEIASHPDDITALRKTAFKAMREENYNIQKNLYKESRKEEVRQHKSVIIEGKKAKKRKIQELENKTKPESSKVSKSEKDHSSMSKSEDNSSMSKSEDDSSMSKSEKDDCSLLRSDKDNSLVSKSNDQDCRNSESDSKMCDTLPEVKSDEDSIKTGAGHNSIKNAARIENDKDNDRKLDSADNEMMTTKSKTVGVVSGEDKEIDDDCGGGDGDKQGNSSKDDCIIVTADDSVGQSIDDKDDVEDDDEDFNVDEMVTEETHVKHSLIQLFTENPWKESVRRPKHWVFPLSQKELLRYEVFRDLWKKGYFLTSGSKFGGDYLVYPGDPARFHSHFIAICIDKTVDLSSLDIVSLGRLGSNVRKTVLLCAYNKSRQIVYTSLQWTGIR